mmetsp:Transcript_86805/g.226552  ORF Transcript_86805/g.226552 Transcript_86805/m.226552 type:complete len:409 (+) Transcript_86805:28-1254(+)
MQSQIRRIDAMDSRLWEWRQKSDEELRHKLAGLEEGLQASKSDLRVSKATTDDVLKKLNQKILSLEERMNERTSCAEEAGVALHALAQRVDQVEQARLEDVSARFKQAPDPKLVSALQQPPETPKEVLALEGAMSAVCKKLEAVQQDSSDIHACLQEQEEKLRSLRTLHEAKEEQYRQLSDRVERENWDGRFKELTEKVAGLDARRIDFAEKLEILEKRLAGGEQAHEELYNTVRKLQERPTYYNAESLPVQVDYSKDDAEGPPDDVAPDFSALDVRVNRGEERLDSLAGDLRTVRQELEAARILEMAPRVNALVAQLTEVAPKIISQEETVRALQDELKKMKGGSNGGGHDLAARVGLLEEEVKRLLSEVEGVDFGQDETEEEVDGPAEATRQRPGAARPRGESRTE